MRGALLVLLLALASPGWADLATFEGDVKKAEASDQDKDKDKERPPASPQDDILGQLAFELFRILWMADNAFTTYAPFPYEGGPFVRLPGWETGRTTAPVVQEGRDSWYTAGVQVFSLSHLGTGINATLAGNAYRFFGPSLEAWTLTDGKAVQNGLRVGAQFSLVQVDPFSLGLYGQYQLWTGTLVRQGGTFGLTVLSLPVKPLTLQARLGVQAFPRFALGESEVQAGWMVGRLEVLAGWRWWTLGSAPREYQGPFAGVRTWF